VERENPSLSFFRARTFPSIGIHKMRSFLPPFFWALFASGLVLCRDSLPTPLSFRSRWPPFFPMDLNVRFLFFICCLPPCTLSSPLSSFLIDHLRFPLGMGKIQRLFSATSSPRQESHSHTTIFSSSSPPCLQNGEKLSFLLLFFLLKVVQAQM